MAAVVRLCAPHRVPIVPRGAGTGYTGGAVPTQGGVVLSLERMNRILEIDEANLVAVVEPHVITGDLQDAVEKVGLFYPPDPASLRQSVIGGNVAECAGGPRAFKYGTTKRYVLGLQAVLPTGEMVETGGKVVKNVVGYDLTQLLVGSEGTLAIITQIILRLVPKPPVQATLRATFPDVEAAVAAVINIIRARVVPAGAGAHRRGFARSGRAEPERAVARAGGHRGDAAARSGRHRAGGRGRSGARAKRRAATPAPPKCCAPATRPSARSCGASAASSRCR